jgi:hypothetical protein
MYIVPTLIDMDYDEARESIGSWRVVWLQIMLGLYICLYLMNMYWFITIIKGSIHHLRHPKRDNKDSTRDSKDHHDLEAEPSQ